MTQAQKEEAEQAVKNGFTHDTSCRFVLYNIEGEQVGGGYHTLSVTYCATILPDLDDEITRTAYETWDREMLQTGLNVL